MPRIYDPDTQAAIDRLSAPSRLQLSRRRFLQMGAAGAGAVAMTPLLSQLAAYAAPPLGTHDPILVLVMMTGGNDGLNTVIPIDDDQYPLIRPTMGWSPAQVLPIGPDAALNPSLVNLKTMFDAGQVAVIRGVHYNPPDFSHFTSMGYWMNAWSGASQSFPTGWVGRYIDNFPNAANEALYSVTLATSGVPLHLQGAQSRASSIPLSVSGRFGISRSNPDDQRLYDGVRAFGDSGTTGTGAMGDLVASTNVDVLRLTRRIATAYPAQPAADYFVRQMQLVGNLINKNLGIRVFNVTLDGFDTHTNEKTWHASLMQSLDNGMQMLFNTVSPTWKSNVMALTFSEFGRRPEENIDHGTDHGTSSVMFAVGPRVKGGLYGQQPSLAPNQLVNYGNLATYVDFRSVYATVLQKWLDADDKQVLGATFPQLGFIASAP